MDTPENYYAILGVPVDADEDTLKRAYRQLARRYHPDLAGPDGALEMKRINRAYAVLSDPEQRRTYDTVISGVVDLRTGRTSRPRPRPHRFDSAEDVEFSGLNIFSTRGPLHAGPVIHSNIGVISALASIQTAQGLLVAAGSLDGKGMLWQLIKDKEAGAISFSADPSFTVESLRELRLSEAGTLLAGWGRLGLHTWDATSGRLLWSYKLEQRAVSAHYSLDAALQVTSQQQPLITMALPVLVPDAPSPRARGVRGTDITSHDLNSPPTSFSAPIACIEEKLESRQFWAIRLRALSRDTRTLLTLSCAQVPGEEQQKVVVRRWSIAPKGRQGGKARPQIENALEVGLCSSCAPPYAASPDGNVVVFVYNGHKLRICDTITNTYSEVPAGAVGSSARLALSSDSQWMAVAREDSEINEGVIDLWSVKTGQLVQKFYHPWQISALRFDDHQLIVALTDGTIQVWQ
jgi:WD40 repeat protein